MRVPVPRPAERGAAAVELVIIVPAIMLIVGMFVFGWRLWSARGELSSVADAAARAAAFQRSGVAASDAARRIVELNLESAVVECLSRDVVLDATGFASNAGVTSSVAVTLRCDVAMSDLLLADVPGSVDVTVTKTQPLDTYRERKP